MLKKNDDIQLDIESVTSEGSAVGHYDGMAVFVRGAVPGDTIIAHIIKGDSDTVLYEVTEDKYYEKTADIFIYLEITGPTEGDSVMIPEKSDYTVAE